LKKNWGQVKKVLGYAWQPDSWDADQDGVEEGAQSNTMDVTYFGILYFKYPIVLKNSLF
jgi:non-lysosomal glucosylceramidase